MRRGEPEIAGPSIQWSLVPRVHAMWGRESEIAGVANPTELGPEMHADVRRVAGDHRGCRFDEIQCQDAHGCQEVIKWAAL